MFAQLTEHASSAYADGGFTMGTPCDPLFLALPLLVAARQQVTCTTVAHRHFHGGHNVDVE